MDFIIGLFIIIVGGCWLISKAIGNALFPDNENKSTYVDKSVHYHYHDNRSVNMDGKEFKGLKK